MEFINQKGIAVTDSLQGQRGHNKEIEFLCLLFS
jgi:hypothetical protein